MELTSRRFFDESKGKDILWSWEDVLLIWKLETQKKERQEAATGVEGLGRLMTGSTPAMPIHLEKHKQVKKR